MKEYLRRFLEANAHMSKTKKAIFLIVLGVILIYILYKISLSPKYILFVGALYTGIVWHELGHGIAAYTLGDDTAKKVGRLSLNPIKHIDPLGIVIPILLIIMGSPFVIGWAKPVPIAFYKIKKQKTALFIIGIAGVVVNIINCFIAIFILHYIGVKYIYQALGVIFSHGVVGYSSPSLIVAVFLMYVILINLALAIFNLIPIPPLDGSRVVGSFLPKKILNRYYSIEKFGIIIVIVLLWLGLLDGIFATPFYLCLKWLLQTFTGVMI